MASEPILDPTSLDPSSVAFSKEEVLGLNRQRDEFEQLDKLIHLDVEDGLAVGYKHQSPEEFWTRGHIPGRPLMPGVLMIEMAAQVSSLIFHLKFDPEGEKFFGFAGVDKVKFRGGVEPGDDLIMVVKATRLRSRMASFEAQGFVGEKFVFEGEVTGIVLS
ncbi:MAG: 3-hydroxyacyl-ACP dehydratase FabZ family protein [Verrucomicrobiota bacterium]